MQLGPWMQNSYGPYIVGNVILKRFRLSFLQNWTKELIGIQSE